MNLNDITPENMTALTEQGYTESDLAMLAKSEVDSLLAVPADDSGSGNVASDPHGDAQAEQDAGNVQTTAEQADEVATLPPEQPFIPQYSAELPADAAEKIKALKDEESESFKKLMDGEITSEDYKAVRERVEAETDDLKTKVLTASIFSQANAQAAEQAARAEWSKAETQAFATFKTEGIDYKAKPALLAAYNTNLKALGADPKNENRDAAWFLTEANRLTKEDLGFVSLANTAKKPVPTTPNRVDPREIPPTLRNVPIAATGAVNADEFAHMRNLDGLELERAHARLTNDQRDRWMAE
jgi:hypothetical protein